MIEHFPAFEFEILDGIECKRRGRVGVGSGDRVGSKYEKEKSISHLTLGPSPRRDNSDCACGHRSGREGGRGGGGGGGWMP